MKKISFLFAFISLTYFASAQACGTCSVNITNNDTLTYNVTTGQMFCISNTGNFSGNITISGGTVCVTGNFNPKSITITSGSILNNGNTSLNTSVSFGNNFNVTNSSGSVLNISGNMTNSANITNNGIINVVDNINNSGTITNSNIINCVLLTGTGTINNTGIINSN